MSVDDKELEDFMPATELEWTDTAITRMKNVPFFVRKSVVRGIEQYAKDKGVACVDDAGTVINPMLVEGQIRGGFAQGLGEALMERLVYDGDGQLVTGSLMDYALPRASDIPAFAISKMETSSPNNPLGAKGVGEAGTIGAPAAILNAAIDALRPHGVTDLPMPLTSETLWRALHRT